MAREQRVIFQIFPKGDDVSAIHAIRENGEMQIRRVAWAFDHHSFMRELQPDIPPLWAGAVHPARESGWISWFPGGEKMGGIPLDEFTKQRYANGIRCPYGQVGDMLAVKEPIRSEGQVLYRDWLTLKIKAIRPERATEDGIDIAGQSYQAGAWLWVVDFSLVVDEQEAA